MISLNDLIIDFCIDQVNQENKINNSICARVDDSSLSILKDRVKIEGNCFEEKLHESDFRSYQMIVHPFRAECMLKSEFFIMYFTLGIIAASTLISTGIFSNLPPLSLIKLKSYCCLTSNGDNNEEEESQEKMIKPKI
ncbi:Oidioi.mRNA.OKI2018_I69.chr1.g1606.t1.cds [Oikopleura dioica]|uniref:Oidioi.mRNA.OKI2018_I69.chr1.g1606.t1.cds n=1 Tax=Oikopleura dioica TaxID=34765 RepID=A0ABN7SNF9_OIKDI|nr:Oidioi.mRNA.OKI2018_I69.chr1.g1606.t1.cds [Oikopleura dioica]